MNLRKYVITAKEPEKAHTEVESAGCASVMDIPQMEPELRVWIPNRICPVCDGEKVIAVHNGTHKFTCALCRGKGYTTYLDSPVRM